MFFHIFDVFSSKNIQFCIDSSKVPPYFDLKYFQIRDETLLESGLISEILSIGQKYVLEGAKTILLGPILFSNRPKIISNRLNYVFK